MLFAYALCAVAILHVLAYLFTHWIVAFDAVVNYRPARSLDEAQFVHVSLPYRVDAAATHAWVYIHSYSASLADSTIPAWMSKILLLLLLLLLLFSCSHYCDHGYCQPHDLQIVPAKFAGAAEIVPLSMRAQVCQHTCAVFTAATAAAAAASAAASVTNRGLLIGVWC